MKDKLTYIKARDGNNNNNKPYARTVKDPHYNLADQALQEVDDAEEKARELLAREMIDKQEEKDKLLERRI